jgi:DNA (cytosine-5)-methyltransferase 1
LQITHSHWDGNYPHPTLNRESGGVGFSNQEIFSQRGAYLAPHATAHRMVAFGEYSDDGSASAMKARDYKDAADLVVTHSVPIAYGVGQPPVSMRESGPGYWLEDEVSGTLDANMGASGHANRVATLVQPPSMSVRRLTPRECERLQGFPDDYTDIKPKGKPTPDGPRYKALGNSMAVPVMAWIGKRIQEVEAINAS